MASALPFLLQYLRRPPLLCIVLAFYGWGLLSYSLHTLSLGLPLSVVILFFDPVTKFFKSPSGLLFLSLANFACSFGSGILHNLFTHTHKTSFMFLAP